MSDRLGELKQLLKAHGQAHLLAFHDSLKPAQRESLEEQIAGIDFAALGGLIETYVKRKPQIDLPTKLEPAKYYPFDAASKVRNWDVAKFRKVGDDLIKKGKVAAFTVAGGQGTRLGWEGPKGTYPATVVTGKPLFRVFAEQIQATQKKYGVTVPWYIMTSPINDADTRAFFNDNNYFGLTRRNVCMFPQGVLPSIDAATGQLLLAGKGELAMNPDGHGGSIKALRDSGSIEDMESRGIEHISYFQVDNPLVRAIDPVFIGLHAGASDSSGEISSKMVAKAYAEEKVGVFCQSQGKTIVIEYSDMPAELSKQANPDGGLRFNAGSIAIHVIGVKFIQKLTEESATGGFGLPYHRADKKVPYVDVKTGNVIQPEKPNAVKLEAFVFDAIPLAESSIVYETSRMEEFAPIKNAEGVDSPQTSHQIQSDRNGAWLEAVGVKVPRDRGGHVKAKIEINPITAMEPGDLKKAKLPQVVDVGQEIVL